MTIAALILAGLALGTPATASAVTTWPESGSVTLIVGSDPRITSTHTPTATTMLTTSRDVGSERGRRQKKPPGWNALKC